MAGLMTSQTSPLRPALLLLTSFLLVVQGCSSEDQRQSSSFNRVIPAVEAVEARYGTLPLEERLSGIVEAGNQVEIYPRISAPVHEVYVQNGDVVEEGEPLIRLDARDYRERVSQAQANLRISEARARQAEARLNEVRNQLRRQKTLYARELSSEAELENYEAQVATAEADYELSLAQVDQARSAISERQAELDRTVIRSPISGVVGGREVEVGMLVNTGTRLFTVGDISNSKVLISLTESMLRYIEIGQTARIYSETLGDTLLYGEISRISPFLSRGSFSTQAEIDIPNQSGLLHPGMFVAVDVLYGESEQATIVPISALYRHPRTGQEGVYIAGGFGSEVEPVTEVESGNPPPLSEPVELEFRQVQVVARGRESAGITGINSGEWIVTVGQSLMVGSEDNLARIRATSWERILAMQQTQPQDLLRQIMNQDIVTN